MQNYLNGGFMKFKFKIQQYQTDAVENTVSVFTGQPSHRVAEYRRDLGKRTQQQIDFEGETGFRNHHIELDGRTLLKNINAIQNTSLSANERSKKMSKDIFLFFIPTRKLACLRVSVCKPTTHRMTI